MTWLNPAAFIGIGLVLVSILIHLLTQRNARLQKFPTLRFLPESPPVHSRRSVPRDLLLMFLRAATIATAVAALAQPLFLTADRRERAGTLRSRAIIVDTSASMLRRNAAGVDARAAALKEAERLATEAAGAVVLQSADVAGSITGANDWLSSQRGQRELYLLSDFQRGTLARGDLDAIDSSVSLRLVQSEVSDTATAFELRSRHGRTVSVAMFKPGGEGEVDAILWRNVAAEPGTTTVPIALLAGTNELRDLRAAVDAALQFGTASRLNAANAIALVHVSHSGAIQLLRQSAPPNERWMGEMIAAVRRDSLLIAAAADATPAAAARQDYAAYPVVARNDNGDPVVVAMTAAIEGRKQLAFFSLADAGSLTSAALASAALRAMSLDPRASEMDPRVIASTELRSWERTGQTNSASLAYDENEMSDARWFWIAALLLLCVEWLIRSSRRFTRRTKVTP